MKKRIAMRLASLALCIIFTGMLFGAPKSKAVVAETAIGTAAVASYFQATGLTMAASAGSTGALVTTGIADIAGSYAMATGAASSGSAFLSSVAAGVSISPVGALVLTAAAVVAIGALVAWYVGENGLDEPGTSVVAVHGTEGFCLYNGVLLPDIESVWPSITTYPYATILTHHNDYYFRYRLIFSENPVTVAADDRFGYGLGAYRDYSFLIARTDDVSSSTSWEQKSSGGILSSSNYYQTVSNYTPFWSNHDIIYDASTVYLAASISEVQGQLEVTRTPEFSQLDTEFEAESKKEMVIDLGFSPGITLDEAVELVQEQIAAGTLVPTYEITGTETGEGTDTETDPDEETGIYIPILSDIKTRLNTLADSIVDGIMDGLTSLFVPSEAYLEALPQQITDTFEERTGFLTYPFSLLPEFVDRLSASSSDWILRWPQIVEPFSNTVLFQAGSFNVSGFMRNNAQIKALYDLYRLMAKVFMSFGFVSLCYYKYRSVVGDDYGGM